MTILGNKKGRKPEGLQGAGLIHSRATAKVMPCELPLAGTLEEINANIKRKGRHISNTELERKCEQN